MNDYPETIIYVDGPGVSCMGEAGDHPKVYYVYQQEGTVYLNYCDIKFMRKKKEEDE